MIFGIGTDIVSIERIRGSLSRHGDRFAKKILTPDEYREYGQINGSSAQYLAKRFAVKEAVAKAMGTGFRDGLLLSDIGITHDDQGKPQLVFSGRAQDFMRQHNISKTHVSISDEVEHALAFVTLECV